MAASQQNVGNPVHSQHLNTPATSHNTGGTMRIFAEEGRVRELAQQMHGRFIQAHQLKQANGQQSQQPQPNPTASQHISQAEEMSKRLKEAMFCLQEAAHDLSLLGLQERFSGMANKLGLKFDIQRSNQTELSSIFLMCDAFYVEVICQDNGHVNSVKLAQANKQVDSEVLTKLVRTYKFDVVESHLRSLKDFYMQGVGGTNTCDPANMYRVLFSIETMLINISKMSPQEKLSEVIMKNPLGHVVPRSAGLPMRLTFFVHPYEVLKSPSLFSSYPSNMERERQVDGPEVGVSAQLLLENSKKVYPLAIDPNVFDASEVKFAPMSSQNSVNIAVAYVLHFTKQFPVSGAIKKELHNVVYPRTAKSDPEDSYQPLKGPHVNQLIAKETADSKGVEVCTNKSRVVCLPNQRHRYYMPAEFQSRDLSENQDCPPPPDQCGEMLSKITFLHPVHIFNIMTLLRKELVYNTLVASVLGTNPKGLPHISHSETELIFEVSTHPADMVTVAVDMQSDMDQLTFEFVIPAEQSTAPLVKVKVGKDGVSTPNQKLSVIIQRCMSIPVTLYGVVKCPKLLGGAAAVKLFQDYLQSICDFNAELSNEGIRGHGGDGGTDMEIGDVDMSCIGIRTD